MPQEMVLLVVSEEVVVPKKMVLLGLSSRV